MSSVDNFEKPNLTLNHGNLHPINQTKDYLLELLKNLGFNEAHGPEIESEQFNFDMLNIKASHPARQMHDTFYLKHEGKLLRTHTSPIQIREMLKSTPPIAITSAGKVYRKDDDATHLPMFHQVEGICIGEDINFSNLKGLIHQIIYSIFGNDVQVRFRPSYFPFTEPSAEVDILSSSGKWLEILGCGIVNPKVLQNCDLDSSKFSGLAFGLGVERIAMLKYGVTDIREFYKSNLDFLEQF
jgi:phenylalanyl-tRNA synthetase alpha chain